MFIFTSDDLKSRRKYREAAIVLEQYGQVE